MVDNFTRLMIRWRYAVVIISLGLVAFGRLWRPVSCL